MGRGNGGQHWGAGVGGRGGAGLPILGTKVKKGRMREDSLDRVAVALWCMLSNWRAWQHGVSRVSSESGDGVAKVGVALRRLW
jgi:hypothetical protein